MKCIQSEDIVNQDHCGGTHTEIGGIAQAQSRQRLPCKTALGASSGLSSVAPIQNIYELTRRVICRTRAGMHSSEGAKYLISVSIIFPKLLGICLRKFCLVAFDAQLGYLNLMVSLQSEYYHPWTSQIGQSLRGTTGQMATYLVSRSL